MRWTSPSATLPPTFVPRGAVHWFSNPFDEPVEMLFAYTRPSLAEAGYRVVE